MQDLPKISHCSSQVHLVFIPFAIIAPLLGCRLLGLTDKTFIDLGEEGTAAGISIYFEPDLICFISGFGCCFLCGFVEEIYCVWLLRNRRSNIQSTAAVVSFLCKVVGGFCFDIFMGYLIFLT